MESFLGQLWWFLSVTNPRVRHHLNWCWIWRDIWESKKIRMEDCHLIQPGDTLRGDWKSRSFAKEIWGQGERDSFAQVLKCNMAGRPFRGQGSGRGYHEEEQWGEAHGW
jgi:hypothetical protein